MFANIKILTNGIAYTTDWDSIDEVSLKDYIKETCYGLVNVNEKAVVNVEVMELIEPEKVYNNNLQDGEGWECSQIKNIEDLVFIYDDKNGELELFGSINKNK